MNQIPFEENRRKWENAVIYPILLMDESRDQSYVIQEAIDSLPQGATLKIPKGKWKANIIINRSDIRIVHDGGKESSHLTPFNPNIDCVKIGNGTQYIKNIEIDITLVGSKNASHYGRGLVLDGVRGFWGRVSVDGFGSNNIEIMPTTNIANSYIYFTKLQTTGSRKSNLKVSNGSSYTTAVYVNNMMNTFGPVPASNCIELDGVKLILGLGWIEASNRKGIKLYNSASVVCNGIIIDSNNSEDILIEQIQGFNDADVPYITGTFACDGRIEFTEKGYAIKLSEKNILFNYEIIGSLYMLDSNRNSETAYTKNDNFRMFRAGDRFHLIHNGQNISIDSNGHFENFKVKTMTSISKIGNLRASDIGYQVYVADTKKPAWWDGAVWRYADGTLV